MPQDVLGDASPDGPLVALIDEEVMAYQRTRARADAVPLGADAPDAAATAEELEAARHRDMAPVFLSSGRLYNVEELAMVELLMQQYGCESMVYPGRLLKYPDIMKLRLRCLPRFTAGINLVGVTFAHCSGGLPVIVVPDVKEEQSESDT